MKLDVGNIVTGTINGVLDYGVFVKLNDNKKGMVHVSQISDTYTPSAKSHFKVGQEIRAKVIGISENGFLKLSLKNVNNLSNLVNGDNSKFKNTQRNNNTTNKMKTQPTEYGEAVKIKPHENFESMLKAFKNKSDEKLSEKKLNFKIKSRKTRSIKF